MDSLTLSSPPINDHLKTKKEIFARNAEVDPLAFAIFSTVPMANRAHLHPPQADIWSWEASPRAGRARRLRSTPSSCFGIRRTLATEPASRMTTSRFGEPPLSARSPIDKFGRVALLGRSSRSLFHFARPSRATYAFSQIPLILATHQRQCASPTSMAANVRGMSATPRLMRS